MRGRISPELRQQLDTARVPRSFDALRARQAAPETDQTPNVDPVLLATTASEVRRLQTEMETMKGQLAAMQQQIRDLGYMVS